ncbi:MAG: hypothetical protein K0R67_1326 [Paenibacillus sp.]|nr:hypothetical protein [Paenibacillus sp.]
MEEYRPATASEPVECDREAHKGSIPVIGFAGYSGSGKTSLAVEVVRILEARGLRIAVVKHDGHGHYKEAEGTDSAAYKAAGASAVAVLSPDGLVIYERKSEPSLKELLAMLSGVPNQYDLILVEGFKGSPIPKIAVVRRQQDLAILEFAASELLAIAASTGVKLTSANVPVLDLDAPEPIVDFIIQYLDEWER